MCLALSLPTSTTGPLPGFPRGVIGSRCRSISGSSGSIAGRSSIGGSSIGGHIAGGGGIEGSSLGSNLGILGEQTLSLGAVKVEPPVADEVVLVEDGSVGAEEAVLGQTALTIGGADVEDLALGLGIGIVASVNLSLAAESGLGNLGQDGVVLAGSAGDGRGQHGQRIGPGVGGSRVEVSSRIGGLIRGRSIGCDGGGRGSILTAPAASRCSSSMTMGMTVTVKAVGGNSQDKG